MSAAKYPRTFPAEEASSWRKTALYPLAFPPEDASAWQRIRKYAVPRWMIEQATQRRLAGDWRGACEAANVDVTFDLAGVADQHGAETAARLETDLQHFAPDLARWHMPRHLCGRTTLSTNRHVLLAAYGDPPTVGPYLHITTPQADHGPQRLTLGFGDLDAHTDNWLPARHLWDVRHADELRGRCGGPDRVPFHRADGTPAPIDELLAADPGPGDPAGRAEWVYTLYDRGNLTRACDVAGILMDKTRPAKAGEFGNLDPPSLPEVLAKYPLALSVLEPWARDLAAAGFGDHFQIRSGDFTELILELHPHIGFGEGLFHQAPIRRGLRICLPAYEELEDFSPLPDACWRRLPDLDLLRIGYITPGELHPLVSASLFPARAPKPTDGPPGPLPLSPARIQCRGEWHEVCFRDGSLQVPHSEEEARREKALHAFGGPIEGCFAVRETWRSGTGRLPDELRIQRDELLSRVQHGDTPGVLWLLDTGLDPHVRDEDQRTLMHLLHLLDHERLLPTLLDAGLEVDARDRYQRTPLRIAVAEGSVALVKALLTAGARTDVVDSKKRSLPRLIADSRRYELQFLKEAIEREHPELSAAYPAREDQDK